MKKKLLLGLVCALGVTTGTVAILGNGKEIVKIGKAITPQTERRLWIANDTANYNPIYIWTDIRVIDVTNGNTIINA